MLGVNTFVKYHQPFVLYFTHNDQSLEMTKKCLGFSHSVEIVGAKNSSRRKNCRKILKF